MHQTYAHILLTDGSRAEGAHGRSHSAPGNVENAAVGAEADGQLVPGEAGEGLAGVCVCA